jgi:hypothetical protein
MPSVARRAPAEFITTALLLLAVAGGDAQTESSA